MTNPNDQFCSEENKSGTITRTDLESLKEIAGEMVRFTPVEDPKQRGVFVVPDIHIADFKNHKEIQEISRILREHHYHVVVMTDGEVPPTDPMLALTAMLRDDISLFEMKTVDVNKGGKPHGWYNQFHGKKDQRWK